MYYLLISCSLILYSAMIKLSLGTTCANDSCWSCGNSAYPLNLTCPSGEVVTGVVKAGYRDKNSNDSSCVYKNTDCLDEPSYWRLMTQIAACMWRKDQCILIGAAGRPLTGACSLIYRAKYLIATNFICVKERYLHTICVSEQQELQSWMDTTKYILSPGLPNRYGQYSNPDYNQTLCTVIIKADPGYGIRIYSVYMDIYRDDYIAISSNIYPNKELFSGKTGFDVKIPYYIVTIEFKVSSGHAHVGFAIRYTSYIPPIEEDSSTTTADTPEGGVTTNGVSVFQTPPQRDPTAATTPKDSNQLMMIIVISFTVMIILIVCLTILLMCLKTQRRQEVTLNRSRDSIITDNLTMPDAKSVLTLKGGHA